MRPGQPDPSAHSDPKSMESSDNPVAIPDFARAWESLAQVASSVRRPSTLCDSHPYQEAIEIEAIFELDERMQDGSIETILVIPLVCKLCKSRKQICSRARPACMRCRLAETNCEAVEKGYQRLPGPKIPRPRKQEKKATCRKKSKVSSSVAHVLTKGRLRPRQTVRRATSLPQV